jgi:hypothetical protein
MKAQSKTPSIPSVYWTHKKKYTTSVAGHSQLLKNIQEKISCRNLLTSSFNVRECRLSIINHIVMRSVSFLEEFQILTMNGVLIYSSLTTRHKD